MSRDWRNVLMKLVRNPEKHARFVNTISLMEYMGARKIMKSQREDKVDMEVLAHMTEEIRHAQIFKKMALKLSGGALQTYGDHHLLAGYEGRAYIQSVDQAVAAALGGQNSHLNYLLSTLLIEERANDVYPFYCELLDPFDMAGPIRGILREEENHLRQIEELLSSTPKLSNEKMQALRMIEQQAFDLLIQAVSNSIEDETLIAQPFLN